MKELYTRTRLCPYKESDQNCNLVLDPGVLKYIIATDTDIVSIFLSFQLCMMFNFLDINGIMAESKDYKELSYYWRAWHEAIGPPLKNKYMRYVQLANQAARLNGNYHYCSRSR